MQMIRKGQRRHEYLAATTADQFTADCRYEVGHPSFCAR